MAKEKTILFVMPRLPFPATSGRKTSLYHYCRILSEELGYRLVVAAFLEAGDDPSQKPAFIDRLVILPKESAKKKILGIAKNSIILQKKPLQVELYWSKTAKEKVNQLMNEENPEIVIGDMIRSTEYIRDLKAYRIADLDDRISLRYPQVSPQFDRWCPRRPGRAGAAVRPPTPDKNNLQAVPAGSACPFCPGRKDDSSQFYSSQSY